MGAAEAPPASKAKDKAKGMCFSLLIAHSSQIIRFS